MERNAITYEREIGTLFADWEQRSGSVTRETRTYQINHQTDTFIRDGVVCPEKWFMQKKRPLFLLKEAYGSGSNWSLISDHLLKDHPIGKDLTWRRVSEWTCGIMASTKDSIIPFRSWNPISSYNNEYLQQIAVVNVKKSGGKAASDMENIRAYADFDKQFLRQQLEICDPTIIICGYTASVLDIIFDTSVRETRNENLFYTVSINGHKVLVLDYWHPANQYPDIMNYYGLMGIYQQALISGV